MCGEGELIKTFLLPGQVPDGGEIEQTCRVIHGKGLGWIAQHHGWEAALWSVFACTVLGIILLAFLWNVRPRG